MSKFSRNDSAKAPEWLIRKNFKLFKYEYIIHSFEAHNLEISNM